MALLQNNAPKNITSSITILVIKTIAIFRTAFFYTPTTCCTQDWIFFQLRYCDIDTAILFVFFCFIIKTFFWRNYMFGILSILILEAILQKFYSSTPLESV